MEYSKNMDNKARMTRALNPDTIAKAMLKLNEGAFLPTADKLPPLGRIASCLLQNVPWVVVWQWQDGTLVTYACRTEQEMHQAAADGAIQHPVTVACVWLDDNRRVNVMSGGECHESSSEYVLD